MESSPDIAAADFPETADVETSTDAYANRFAGPVGAWMLTVQLRHTLDLLAQRPGATILDVGGGHGQLAVPLARAGYSVTVVGSAPSCRNRVAAVVDDGLCAFEVGNVIDLPHPDKAFDVALSFRLLTHCDRWERLVAELCRTARQAVIVDYPTSQSLNCIAPALFGAKKRVETDTRAWRLFRHAEVRQAFAAQGWRVVGVRKQFCLPMVLHRMLRRRGMSAALEGLCRAGGLTRALGSPVIVAAVPEAGPQ